MAITGMTREPPPSAKVIQKQTGEQLFWLKGQITLKPSCSVQQPIKVTLKPSCSVQRPIKVTLEPSCSMQRPIKVTLKPSCSVQL